MSTFSAPVKPVQYRMHDSHSVVVGYLLWLFGGIVGVHRFYFGKPVSGVIWFLTGGLLGIGWLVDLFLVPGMQNDCQSKYVSGRSDYSIAWILHFFFGVFGVHRMYCGKWVSGIIYLLTGGLLGIGWLYDFFVLNEVVDDCNRQDYLPY